MNCINKLQPLNRHVPDLLDNYAHFPRDILLIFEKKPTKYAIYFLQH